MLDLLPGVCVAFDAVSLEKRDPTAVGLAERVRGACADGDHRARHRYAGSSSPRITGLMSRIGVSSSASRLFTRIRGPSISKTSTRCSPIGLGRSGERVLNTPCSG